jgi:type I restriction enzyme S subunit
MSVREGYKQTEIGVIPEEWKIISLKDIVYPDRGITYGIVQPGEDISPNGIPLIRGKDYSSGKVCLTGLYHVSPEIDLPYKRSKVKENDILLTIVGYVGQTAIVPKVLENANITQTTARISVNHEIANYQYVDFFLNSYIGQKNLKKFEKGSAQAGLNLKDIDKVHIFFPPLPEQQKIAEILSTVDQKIDSIDSKIEETQTLKRGLMQRLLSEGIGHSEFKESEIGRIPAGWEVDRLENHVTIVSGQSPSSFDLYGEQYKFFKVNQLNFCTKYLYESEYAFDLSNYNNLQAGTVIFPKRGASIFTNKVRILATEGYIDTNLMGLITKKTLNNEYLYYWLISFELSNVADTSSVPQINNKHINPLKFPLPPFEEQKLIAEILSTIDEKLETLRAKKEAFETLKKGLMQKLLSGEVRVAV